MVSSRRIHTRATRKGSMATSKLMGVSSSISNSIVTTTIKAIINNIISRNSSNKCITHTINRSSIQAWAMGIKTQPHLTNTKVTINNTRVQAATSSTMPTTLNPTHRTRASILVATNRCSSNSSTIRTIMSTTVVHNSVKMAIR